MTFIHCQCWTTGVILPPIISPNMKEPSVPASNADLFVCISSSPFMLLIQPGMSVPLLALYLNLNLYHSSKINWIPTTIFTTVVNHNNIAILITPRVFVSLMKYFMAINNTLFVLWVLFLFFFFFHTSLPVFLAPGGKVNFSCIFGSHSLAPCTYESIKHKADIHSCAQSLWWLSKLKSLKFMMCILIAWQHKLSTFRIVYAHTDELFMRSISIPMQKWESLVHKTWYDGKHRVGWSLINMFLL